MMSQRSRRVDDPLWKSILEQTFSHFLRFIFTDADAVFDLSRPFDYLDKEFENLFPPESTGRGVRYVDKLVKVFLKDGSEQFVLCHVEIQSHKGRGDLAERMFRYFYRIWDRYKVPITAIAILADENKGYRPVVYCQEFMGTSLRYDFNSYKILDQEESELRSNRNPFSVIVLTALLAIVNKKVTDEGLKEIKHDLYDEMMKREMDKSTRQGLYDFLTYYVSFDNEEVLSIFEEEIKTKIGRSDTMGTQEYLLDKAEKKGIQKGKIEGKIEMLRELGFTITEICQKLGLAKPEVEKFFKGV